MILKVNLESMFIGMFLHTTIIRKRRNQSLPSSLAGAWCVDDYWEKSPSMMISRIKIALEDLTSGEITEKSFL